MKREARYRSAGRTGRKSARARGAGTYSNNVAGYLPPDVGVRAPVPSAQGDACCSCGVGNAGPPGLPGSDGEKGTSSVVYKVEEKSG